MTTQRCNLVAFLSLTLVTVAGARSIQDLNLPRPLPTFITPVTTFGQRPDWAHDGRRIVFLEKTSGDVYEVDIATRELTPLTHDYPHEGYTRALYLANGDILLSGARTYDATNPGASRNEKNAELWVLRPGSGKPPVPLGAHCREGPAVSRTRMRINWAVGDEFHVADIVYDPEGIPRLANDRVVLTHADLPNPGWKIEAQNFRPGAEHELIFNMYTPENNVIAMVMGIDLDTGKIVHYSNRPEVYDEPEGIFPDGKRTLVESNRQRPEAPGMKNYQPIDLWVLELDGSERMTRLTNFNDDPDFKASQGVISDDGRYMAFQISRTVTTRATATESLSWTLPPTSPPKASSCPNSPPAPCRLDSPSFTRPSSRLPWFPLPLRCRRLRPNRPSG
ncbi:MAG: hypothetical protein R3F07_17070 [Opitutaceae bacterium]